MLVVTMCIHGSDGKPTLSVAQPPGTPEVATQAVCPTNCRSVCCLGTAVSVQMQPAPSGVIAPPVVRSSAMQIGPGSMLRVASAITGPPAASALLGLNCCSGLCGATIAKDWPGWNTPGLLERPGMWMKRSQEWNSTSALSHGPAAAQVA